MHNKATYMPYQNTHQMPHPIPNRPTHLSKLPQCSLRKPKVRHVAKPVISRVPYTIYARVEECFETENWQETGAYTYKKRLLLGHTGSFVKKNRFICYHYLESV